MDNYKIKLKALAQQLKSLCDEKGKEKSENICRTSGLLCQMAILYKDEELSKLGLIQSAALLNAAIVRQPENQEFLNELKQLCFYVLKTAKAEKAKEDLVEFSSEIISQVKRMRNNAKTHLANMDNIPYEATDEIIREMELKKIEDINVIQNKIAADYKQIMNNISDKCVAVLGKPPCKYTLVGMGSLARREITPYSDFEHIIVLEDGIQGSASYVKVLEYFRWYSTIFLIILVNLRETILKFLTIPCLNDVLTPDGNWFYDAFTPCGISPDGFHPAACKTPLGRTQETKDKKWTTEFIKPASEMARFLDSEVCVREGYHIASMLRETCFVSGDKEVYKSFVDQVRNVLHHNEEYYKLQLQNELADDLKNLSISDQIGNVYNKAKCDIKRMVYRTSTLFVSAIGKMENLEECSCFDIIAVLQKKKVINDETAHKLFYAVAVSCQARLKVYISKEAQDDFIERKTGYYMNYGVDTSGLISTLINTVGDRSLVDYLVIVFLMKLLIQNTNSLEGLDQEIKLRPSLRFMMLEFLCLYDNIIKEWKQKLLHKENNESFEYRYDLEIQNAVASAYVKQKLYEEALPILEELFTNSQIAVDTLGKVINNTCQCFFELKKYEDEIEFIDKATTKISQIDSIVSTNWKDILKFQLLLPQLASCQLSLGLYDKALLILKEQMAYFQTMKRRDLPDSYHILNCHLNMCQCLLFLGKYEEAISHGLASISLLQECKLPIETICNCHLMLGVAYTKLEKYNEALNEFETELQIRTDNVPSEFKQTDIGIRNAEESISTVKNKLEASNRKM